MLSHDMSRWLQEVAHHILKLTPFGWTKPFNGGNAHVKANGKPVNGQPVNGKHVNGKAVPGVKINGIAVNGATVAQVSFMPSCKSSPSLMIAGPSSYFPAIYPSIASCQPSGSFAKLCLLALACAQASLMLLLQSQQTMCVCLSCSQLQ